MGTVRRAELRLTLALLGVVTVVAANVTPRNDSLFIDQMVFWDTHERMRAGAGYYEAFRDAFLQVGVTLGELRAYRQPLLFLAWWPVPTNLLEPLFFLVCVLGTGVAALFVVRRPIFALLPALWLVVGGHHVGADGWLLSELWAAPLVVAACGAWLRGRHGWASAAATGAILVREITAPLLLGFAFVQWRRGRPIRPYVAGIAASVVAFAVHAVLAVGYLDPPGNSAETLGTGNVVAVASMTSYGGLLVPRLVGLALWAGSLVRLWRSSLQAALGLALLPLSGLVIGRIYWGMAFMPLLVAILPGIADERAAPGTGDADPDGSAVDLVVHGGGDGVG